MKFALSFLALFLICLFAFLSCCVAQCSDKCCGYGSLTNENFVGQNFGNSLDQVEILFFNGSSGGSVQAVYNVELELFINFNVTRPGELMLNLTGQVGSSCKNANITVIDKTNNFTLINYPIYQEWSTETVLAISRYVITESSQFFVIVMIPGRCKVHVDHLIFDVTQMACS